jgi:hypothetical protein
MKKISYAVLALACLAIFMACGKSGKTGEITGVITIAIGEVTVNGKPAKVNDTIKFGDIIETKKDSKCRIVIDGQNVIETWKDSAFVFKLKEGDGLIELRAGSMGAVMKNFSKVKEFRISTTTVAAGIRGTVLCINVESADRTYACTCNGKIAFKAGGQGAETVVSAAHHKAATYERVGDRITTKEAGMLYHTDEKMNELAAGIGVKIDWGKVD